MGGVGVVGWDMKSGAKCPVFFPLLDNPASMLAGIKLHYEKIGRKVNVVAFAGDGATTDAGMQCLSGAAERGDKIIYICYDNEGYMNTGYQRSSSTTRYSWTSTTPVTQEGRGGKRQNKKDFPMIMAMHDIPYMATCSPAFIPDMVKKLETAMEKQELGLAYLHVFNPCLTGWGIKTEESIDVSRLSVETNFFPLYEVIDGKFIISREYKNPKPVAEYLRKIKKFSHLNDSEIENIQLLVDQKWNRLKQLASL
jgi:pyruvate ferredoxin oxidoreductase beta subunit/phenylglyoxylate dehydrogenase beta subunit